MKFFKNINNKSNLILIIGIAILFAYSAYYIFLNSYVINGVRYFSLFDDAMISMRYAENIAHGYGPVWNPGGAFVEGYSNPLWVYIMAIIHNVPIAKAHISILIQILAIIILAINLIFIKKITDILSGGSILVSSVTVLTSSLYLHLNNWAVQGMEVSLITLIVSITVYINLINLCESKFSLSQLILPGILIWVRMDTVLLFFVTVLFLYFYDRNNNKRILLSGLIIFVFFLGSLLIWRYYYYQEWLPNTYYLKITGYPFISRIGKGFYTFLKFILYLTPIIFALPFWLLIKVKKNILILPISMLVVMIFYSIYTGGDSWEWWMPVNRFIIPVMPVFIVIIIISVKYFISIMKYNKSVLISNLMFILLSVIILIAINYNSWEYLKGELLLERSFTEKDNSNQTRLALEAKKILNRDAIAVVAVAGVLPYFLERKCIDLLGKNDKVIAKMHVKLDSNYSFFEYNPGHMKWNYSYSIAELKPDVVLHLWKDPIKALPYLKNNYYVIELSGFEVFLNKNSKKIRWDLINELSKHN